MKNVHDTFKILDSKNLEFKFIVVSINFSPLEEKLSDINLELCKKNFIGNVLFNFRTSSCSLKRQYTIGYFDGHRVLISSLRAVSNVDSKTEKIVDTF